MSTPKRFKTKVQKKIVKTIKKFSISVNLNNWAKNTINNNKKPAQLKNS